MYRLAEPRRVWGLIPRKNIRAISHQRVWTWCSRPMISTWELQKYWCVFKLLQRNYKQARHFNKKSRYVFTTIFQFYVVILSNKIQIYLNIMNSYYPPSLFFMFSIFLNQLVPLLEQLLSHCLSKWLILKRDPRNIQPRSLPKWKLVETFRAANQNFSKY